MNNLNLEQLANSQKANAEVMVGLMRSAFNGMEQLTALNLEASRELFNASVASTQQLMSIKDPKELAKLNSALAQPNVEKMTEYSRRLYDLVTAMQKDITAVMETQYSSFTKTATGALEKTTAATPIGGDIFSAAMKQMLDASNKAYGNMTQMAKQMSDIADVNTKSAASATSRAAAAAKKK